MLVVSACGKGYVEWAGGGQDGRAGAQGASLVWTVGFDGDGVGVAYQGPRGGVSCKGEVDEGAVVDVGSHWSRRYSI